MKNLREEIEKLKRDPETITDDLVKLFRSWVDDRVLIKLRLIRANLPLSEPHCAEARERLKAVIDDVEEAK